MVNNNNYAFLTTLIPENSKTEIENFSRNNMQEAANALEWKIFNGLSKNLKTQIKIINVLPIGSFPQFYRLPFIKTKLFDTEYSKKNTSVGFCNIKLIRNFFIYHSIKKELKKWCKSTPDGRTLFVYTASSNFMKAVQNIKKSFKNTTICTIIADLPDMTGLSSKSSILTKMFSQKQADTAYNNINASDYFVLLTKQMAEYMNITKPYCVMEGIAGDSEIPDDTAKDSDTKTILYTGTLHRRFGVINLVKAFMQIPNENYRLQLCGAGDSKDEIRECANRDKRIEFYGQVPREKVLKMQAEANVLINPRQNTEEFTKYSFPSKNLEYLSSGKPLIAYKLDGIPDEYDDYIYYVPENSPEALSETIIKTMEMPEEELNDFGNRAKDFVLNQKNCVMQTKKIVDMMFDAKEIV